MDSKKVKQQVKHTITTIQLQQGFASKSETKVKLKNPLVVGFKYNVVIVVQ
jgi:hypothetical protein